MEVIKMKIGDAVDLWQTINKLQGEDAKYPTKFVFALSKIQEGLKPIIEHLDSVQKPTKEFEEYTDKRMALFREFAEKEEDGSPKMRYAAERQGTEFVISKGNKKEFEKRFSELNLDYEDIIEKQQKKMEKVFELMKEEKEVSIYKITLDDFPKEFGAGDMKQFVKLVREHTVH